MQTYTFRDVNGRRTIDEGPAGAEPPVVLLHGLLGNPSNWYSTVDVLAAAGHRVLVPLLPIYDLPLRETNVPGLVDDLHAFLTDLGLDQVVLVGNSLGGHIALLYALQHPDRVAALGLSGASGIYELEVGTYGRHEKESTFSAAFRRKDPAFIRERAALTFYDDRHVTDELVEEMLGVMGDRGRALRLIRIARSVQEETVVEQLGAIQVPTLLVWGRDDQITPPDVADTFESGIPQAELHVIDRCGHAPMIEHPAVFDQMLLAFLQRTLGVPTSAVPRVS